ncbi:restriction endonuclease subunit S [Zoogloea sp. LCSB751]|uniref:restriction endonuclease subunit S n=1 Tax=Zoogloea sp. LCSB751 TaxID=1965277 RepID=UPI0009A4E76A|nr:restriction endonuclease subunit S [Zoogloea sp. LCSB751]
MKRLSISEVLLDSNRPPEPSVGELVWNLNLDQIESGTGKILDRVQVPVSSLGPSTYPFSAGTVLYSKLRPYLNKVVVADMDGYATTELVPLRCNPEKVHAPYLAHYLRSPEFLSFANTVVAGAKMPRMVMNEFWRYQVPVPSMPEQLRIAAILDQADALRTKRREALVQLDSLTQSIFIEMFGDPTINPKGIKVVRLADVTTRITDGVHQKPNYRDDGIPFVSVKDITTGVLNFERCKFISEDDHRKYTKRCKAEYLDILYTKVGATYGRPALVDTDREFSLYVSVCLIKPRREVINPFFLNAALGTPATKKQADSRIKGIGVPDLHLNQIQDFIIPLPDLEEQQRFSDQVASIERQKKKYLLSMMEIESLMESLQYSAFRGEL